MHIFIAARVPRADTHQQALCTRAVQAVRRSGHTPFLAYQEILDHGLVEAHQFMPFVRDGLRQAGLLVLLYHPELRGGLLEAGMAYAWRIPIWLAHTRGERVSTSTRGVAEQVLVYQDAVDLEEKLYACLCQGRAAAPRDDLKMPREENSQ